MRTTGPAVAVITACSVPPTWSAEAVKLAEVCPPGTVTTDGTVKLPLLLDSPTPNPPARAVPLRETVHWVLPGAGIVARVQVSAVSDTAGAGSAIVPEPPIAGIELPADVEATTAAI